MPKTGRSTEKATIAPSRIVVAMFRVPWCSAPTQSVLCFDGRIDKDTDVSLAARLSEGGLIVVRSIGGDIASTIALSNVLRNWHATVVVHDHCLSSCANYLLIASSQAYVLKGTLVAWDDESSDPAVPSCARFAFERTPHGDFRLQRGSCRPAPADEGHWRDVLALQTRFFRERMVDPLFEPPPDNRYLRKLAKILYRDTSAYHHIGWTPHPGYYARLFRTRIVYEAYPADQSEIDEMVERLHLKMRVIYDP